MALAEILSSMTMASKIVNSILKVSKDAAVNEKVIKLQRVILSLQDHMLSMQSEYSKLTEIKNDLEKKLMEYKDWDKTKSQYILKEVSPGVLVRSPKENNNLAEPKHWLCANCFDEEKKSILQLSEGGSRHYWIYSCQKCKAELSIPRGVTPETT